ncbi:IclR family transcriptional regulator [Occultella glacieicola]|uniref:IclR family transcriptional regulator n=1 Tax=Occultella glacieicola TaxID=2518684 RepID=A0ABY2E3E0_9MICO|nr:IclR family transcriptional regulator [Occultella glacieicola]TDE94153.1 IclR family transcriptional regulator [Occultella glacieicola]
MGAPGAGHLQTVGRALAVLRAFTHERPTRGVSELARELGMDKSQAQRVLATLAAQGFTVLDPVTRRYSLGPSLVVLGHLAEHSEGVRHRLEPHLAALSVATRESAVVCVPDGARYRTVAAVDGPGMVRYNTALGRTYPGHLGATGHAIFAFSPALGARDVLDAYGAADPSEAEVAALERRHEEVRKLGYAVSVGEFDDRVMAISAPILLEGVIFGSVSTLGPPQYMADRSTELIEAVSHAASTIGATLRS